MKVEYHRVLYYGSGITYTISINEIETCPICKHSIRPVFLHGVIYDKAANSKLLSITYYCTHCHQAFICNYCDETVKSSNYYTFNKLFSIAPNAFEELSFEECILNISPQFVKIYNQAAKAEHYELDEIAGIGYRKALEFLIKDFLITQTPEKSDIIKNTPLGNCVNSFIDNPQLQTVASRAVWLGNDQTHYIQKFEDKDINDLKRLIKLTINWITMLYLTNEAENIEKP